MARLESFSEREREVIALLLQGKSNKQIALQLAISASTVEFHLSNIYNKLQVASRTEAVLKLGKSTGVVSTGELGESTVAKQDQSVENGYHHTSQKVPMKTLAYIVVSLLTTILVVMLVFLSSTRRPLSPVAAPTASEIPPTSTPTIIPSPTVSPKEHILEQVRELAEEYDQAVQAEKKNGEVEFGKDPITGEEIFHFKGESYERIANLSSELNQQIFHLYQLYDQVYRDEINPTPFPTQSSPDQNKTYYEFLLAQAQDFCPTKELDVSDAIVMIYDPDDGKYRPVIINDEFARCDIYGQMIEEWRTAPILEKVNKEADISMIHQVMGKADLQLNFDSISGSANAPGRNAASYKDETGAQYLVDVETARLMEVVPNFQSHPNVSADKRKSMDELRGVARQFAMTNSPRLAQLENTLLYEENCKGDICFFRWDYRNKDWSGTDWMMMPPFLQVGVLADGRIVTYHNTLDLFE